MKILFVFYNKGSGISFHPGIQILSAISKQLGHDTKLYHIHDSLSDEAGLVPEVLEYNPDIVAFTSTDFEYNIVKNLAKQIKYYLPKAFIVLGGKAAMHDPKLEETAFDAFCIGEAEIPWKKLLEHLSGNTFHNLPSWWFKSDGKIIKNGLGDLTTIMDDLPFLDFEIFDTKKILEGKGGWLSMTFTRGCPYQCTYCYTQADKKLNFGKDGYGMKNYLRRMSPKRVISEVKNAISKYPVKVINWDDELPILDHDWILEVCRLWKKEIYQPYGVEFCLNGRVNVMNEEIIKALSESGCREIRIGFEAGSYRIRKEILNKDITNEQLENIYALCDLYSLNTTSFTMIGIPTESRNDWNETVKLTAKLKPNLVRLTFCYPFEHTPIYDYVIEHNILNKDKYYSQMGYFEESPLKWDDNLEQILMEYKYLFPWLVNLNMKLGNELLLLYLEAMRDFIDRDFRNKETLQEVLNRDNYLSKLCGDKEHYCFHQNGYIWCKNKKYKTVRPIVMKKIDFSTSEVIDATGFTLPWVGDDRYFLIRINRETEEIEAGCCKNDMLSVVTKTIKGQDPINIYHKILSLGLIARLEHAAYLGKELSRAYIALKTGKEYVQDDKWDDII